MNNDTEIKSNNKIIIDYYRGAYGPTIQINLPSKEALIKVKDILQKLSNGSILECKLQEIPFFYFTGLDELNLRVDSKSNKSMFTSITVKRVKIKKVKIIFDWSNSLNGWDDCVGLLEGFREESPGHQYLSNEGFDDALIVVSYLELKNGNSQKKNEGGKPPH